VRYESRHSGWLGGANLSGLEECSQRTLGRDRVLADELLGCGAP